MLHILVNSRQISKTFSVTTSWTRVILTFPADTTGAFTDDNGVSLYVTIWLVAGPTYSSGTLNSSAWADQNVANRASGSQTNFFDSTSRTLFVTGLQLEVGPQSTDFEHEPYGTTLHKCQRYYQVIAEGATNQPIGNAEYYSSSQVNCIIHLQTPMRAGPTIDIVSGTNYYRMYRNSGNDLFNDFEIDQSSPSRVDIRNNTHASGTAGQSGMLRLANANAKLAFTAEL